MAKNLKDTLSDALAASYSVERELPGGGMSSVFLAEDLRLKRRVVIKVLRENLAAGISAQRFEREIKIFSRLQHPNIVPVLTAGEIAGLPYYTMPFVDGPSLRQRLNEPGRLSLHESVEILRDIAKALSHAHKQGVVHRDIKPENVLI